MARAVAFLGPALRNPAAEPRVELRPPAERGDVLRAAEDGARIIGLIDGLMIGSLAVTPAELRHAHRMGVRIVGGASLGAIRAVECPDAVEGIGEVYEAFASGILRDDDELVGTFDHEYRQIAFPLVVIRDRCRAGVDSGALTPAEHDDVIALAKSLPFYDRTARRILGALEAIDPARARAVERLLSSTADDVKARDARVVLDLLAAAVRNGAGVVP